MSAFDDVATALRNEFLSRELAGFELPGMGGAALRLAGVRAPAAMDGADLSPLLAGRRPAQARPFWFGGYANHWYYRDDRWAMIADGNNTGRELFDLRRDPGEVHNIARDHLPLLAQIHERVLRATGLRRLPYFGRR